MSRPTPQHFSQILTDEFQGRVNKNSSYSMRAFARDLGLSAAGLSSILNKKSGLSLKRAQGIAAKLNLSEEDQKFFCALVEVNCSRYESTRKIATAKLRQFDNRYNLLSIDSFKIISEWYHFAIIELMNLKNFQNDPRWMAEKLGITIEDVEEALDRMLRLEMITKEKGRYKPVSDFFMVTSQVPVEAGQKFHATLLKKAAEKVFSQSIQERNVSNAIIRARKVDIPRLNEKIKAFRRELSQELEAGDGHDAVYNLGIHLVRLDQDL